MGHCPLLMPFWGVLAEPAEWIATLRFDRFAESGRAHFSLSSSIAEADVAVLPGTWNHYERHRQTELAIDFVERMTAAGKQTIVFVDTDRYEPLPFANALVFRTSMYRSRRQPNEFAQPAWSGDLMRRYCNGVLPLREKREVPVVGFCGLVAPVVRRRALDALRASPRVATSFVERRGFFGGTIRWSTVKGIHQPRWNQKRGIKVRREYVENLVSCDYVLCARGGGNFSHRFYEALICGRIPVFVDTDCVLPYDGLPRSMTIDWRRHAVWCDETEIAHIADIVADFHQRLTVNAFREMQLANRQLWEERLSAHGFFSCLHEHLPVSQPARDGQ